MALHMSPTKSESPEAFHARATKGELTWEDCVEFKAFYPPDAPPAALHDLSPISVEAVGDNLFKYRLSDDDAKEVLERYYSDEEGARVDQWWAQKQKTNADLSKAIEDIQVRMKSAAQE
ncbi:hypothetical protein HBI23_254530 [Parastagonospora nodorum]|nr:hypothetical protein HBI23_254530 [Parastagonospora nodorum]KAH5621377.1 hypothetical protein HBI51_250150 [Parastagonospora nodorum]KAH5983253.1 hypothetical protein HBI84_248390 [Parastagonospora nodorum]KAH6133515.1 hypothetical protein HBI68_252910 [Parastagonospora nodorum]KAH6383634.1 hypothetical protein HBI60_255380 [Parastagonospora nodorum]